MAFILSLEVMDIRDAINFCPVGENKQNPSFVLSQDNSILKYGAEVRACFHKNTRKEGPKDLVTPKVRNEIK